MRCLVILAVLHLVFVGRAAGQEACADNAMALVGVDTKVLRPSAYTAAASVALRLANATRPPEGRVDKPGETWSKADVDRLRKLTGGAPSTLIWIEAGKPECAQVVSFVASVPTPATPTPTPLPAPTPAPATPAAPVPATPAPQAGSPTPPTPLVGRLRQTGYGENDCERAGQEWLNRLRRANPTRPQDKFTVLVFHEDGGLCFSPNDRPSQGNPIHVGVFASDITAWTRARITFQPCSLEPTAPNVLVQGQLPTLEQLQADNWSLFEFPARQCWDGSVLVRVEGNQGRELTHTLTQATLYRATVHLGTVFTENHETTFGLRPGPNDTQVVFAEGPVDTGPEYVAAVVFYSLLRYIPPLGGRAAYPGRDPVRDNGFADKLGGVIGIGLRNPLKRFVTGFSFELAAGVNILGVWDFAETEVLNGINDGDIFPSDDEELIPTQKEWRQKFVFGVSMDLVYATNAFRR